MTNPRPSRTPAARREYYQDNADYIRAYMQEYHKIHAEDRNRRRRDRHLNRNHPVQPKDLKIKKPVPVNAGYKGLQFITKKDKLVIIEYPDVANPDRMSKTEFSKWGSDDFPAGTRVWIDGKEIPMQMTLMEAEIDAQKPQGGCGGDEPW